MSEVNKNLSICIPTYNGAEKIKENLNHLLGIVKPYNIAIYISDNASTDSTEQTIREFQKQYEYIFYSRNIQNLGADRNFEIVLKKSNARYCWLLGNDDLIVEKAFLEIYNAACEEIDYAFICVNTIDRVKGINDCIFNDYNDLMQKIGSHLTHMSALIFNRALIDFNTLKKYYDTWFLQTCLAFDVAAKSNMPVKWISTNTVVFAEACSFDYSNVAFYTFTTRLYNVALLFDEIYSLESRKSFVRKHLIFSDDRSGKYFIFSGRIKKELTLIKFFKYHKAIKWAIPFAGRVFAFCLCLIPIPVINIMRKMRKKLVRRSNQ